MVCLGLHPPGPHLLGKPVRRREDERVSSPEEVDGPGGFVAATTTVEVAEHMACEWVSVGWCSALWDVIGGTPVLGLRLVCRWSPPYRAIGQEQHSLCLVAYWLGHRGTPDRWCSIPLGAGHAEHKQ